MIKLLRGDCRDVLRTLPADSVHCCVTSPPYFGLRDYGVDGQIGLEPTPDDFVAEMVAVFREVRRVLRADGTAWLNLGDSYAERSWKMPSRLKPKDLIGIPWRVAFALQADGWWLRSAIVWAKPNPMPESVTDRPTSAYEMVFLLAKSERYFYDAEAIKEPVSVEGWDDGTRVYGGVNKAGANVAHGYRTTGRVAGKGNAKTFRGGGAYTKGQSFENSTIVERDSHGNAPNSSGLRNARNVWTIATRPFPDAHFATMAPDLAERCIKAGCPAGGTVLDPFGGAGTTGLVADRLQRDAILIELNPEYAAMAQRRIQREAGMFADVSLETTP